MDWEKLYSTYWNDQKSVSLLEIILKWRNVLTEKPGTKYILDISILLRLLSMLRRSDI